MTHDDIVKQEEKETELMIEANDCKGVYLGTIKVSNPVTLYGEDTAMYSKNKPTTEVQEDINKLSYKNRMKLKYSNSEFDLLKYYKEATDVYHKKHDIFIEWLKEKGETEKTIIDRVKKFYRP